MGNKLPIKLQTNPAIVMAGKKTPPRGGGANRNDTKTPFHSVSGYEKTGVLTIEGRGRIISGKGELVLEF